MFVANAQTNKTVGLKQTGDFPGFINTNNNAAFFFCFMFFFTPVAQDSTPTLKFSSDPSANSPNEP